MWGHLPENLSRLDCAQRTLGQAAAERYYLHAGDRQSSAGWQRENIDAQKFDVKSYSG